MRGVVPVALNSASVRARPLLTNSVAIGKIAKNIFVTLLGDLRRSGDVDDKRHAALLGDLGDGRRGARVERTDQAMRAFLNQFFRSRARGVDVRLGVGIEQFDVDAETLFNDERREIGAFLTRLADQAL